jgi:hypothetical protein
MTSERRRFEQITGKAEGTQKMARTPFISSNPSRKPMGKVSAFYQSREKPIGVWRPTMKERVQTPNGIGVVMEISGDMFLVDLDNQHANVWERLTSIRIVK